MSRPNFLLARATSSINFTLTHTDTDTIKLSLYKSHSLSLACVRQSPHLIYNLCLQPYIPPRLEPILYIRFPTPQTKISVSHFRLYYEKKYTFWNKTKLMILNLLSQASKQKMPEKTLQL